MAHRIPETSRPRSARDYFLQSLFRIVRLVSSPTLFRLWLAFFILLPTYIFTKAISVLPTVLGNILLLFDTAGRSELRRQADSYRRKEEHQARQQLNGTFRFQQAQLVSPRKHAIRQEANWYPNIEDFEVCGARVNVVVERSVEGQDTGQTVVLLHGSLGWSFMWRGVIPLLTAAGHTVYAPDLLGHGLSDKPTSLRTISLSLHMCTLIALFEHFDLRSATIVAHDWGGCIAACAAPYLSTSPSPRLLLLDSFMPLRAQNLGWSAWSGDLLRFLATGISDAALPVGIVLRLLSPTAATVEVVKGYTAPYASGGPRTAASLRRFVHLLPPLPGRLLALRHESAFRVLEGLAGPHVFTNLNARAGLAERGRSVREFCGGCSREGWRVGVLGGKGAVEGVVDRRALWDSPGGGWVDGAGYLVAEKGAGSVAEVVARFLEETEARAVLVGG